MTKDEILKKYEDDNEYHFHQVDREWIMEAMEEYTEQQLRLYSVSNRRELLIDFCSKVEETLEMYGHLAPNEAYIDEYLQGN